GQVAISNELFKLLEEEIKSKRNNIKQQENKNIAINQEDRLLEEKNTISDIKAEESPDFNTIEILQNQIKLKDNQITILNNVITNNLKRIKALEEKQQDYKNLSEEIKTLKITLDDLSKIKNKRKILGLF
uniref:DNA-binding protein n=3 Tax=Clostridium perfringens TaxID=1502 RepID=UPI00096A731B